MAGARDDATGFLHCAPLRSPVGTASRIDPAESNSARASATETYDRDIAAEPSRLREPYEIGDRRPLASRGWKSSERAAAWLARSGVSPNAISVVGMFCGIGAGFSFAATARAANYAWIFWLGGALLVQLRLLANLYDGMVAVARKIASPVGELFNEVPDRISDPATLIGFGYAAGSDVRFGFAAACVALFLAYLRAQGKVAGAHQEFCGPMAKQQRMATVTIASGLCAFSTIAVEWSVPKLALGLIVAGGIVTALRRCQRIAAALRSR